MKLSNQGAQLFRALGLKSGDHIALLMENRLAFMEICWAAQRSGLYYTAISRYLKEDEIAYIVKDSGAKVVITSPRCAEQIKGLVGDGPGEPLFFILDQPLPGFAPGSRRRERSLVRRSRTKSRAMTCCIRRARPAGPRASRGRSKTVRSTRRTRSCA
jgi:acyl-CoA synthetase (AMP-forming)/AMP-acid ligase II